MRLQQIRHPKKKKRDKLQNIVIEMTLNEAQEEKETS